ncbi:hypothetical protein JFL43_13265 [Viridibacillus sp. YIM B01967]|uniref:Uncharacterized protein n=1 Tax=Viridibacillus soli TaxID=2798301 RepID=A0ABS1H8R7_9BACL|nr:hypothetical protein [Viridibacillus soli]MBK3495808.1 hypothetical protein [Viridibacillus soli]
MTESLTVMTGDTASMTESSTVMTGGLASMTVANCYNWELSFYLIHTGYLH